MTWLVQIGAALGGLSFLGGIITAITLRIKTKADATSVLTDTALNAATRSIESLERRLEQTTNELQAVRHHMGVLEVLLRQRGVPVPDLVWPPKRNGVA